MPEQDATPITADEFKGAVRVIRAAVGRLWQSPQADIADKAVDTIRDHGLRAIERAPSGYPGTAISGH